MSAQGEEFTSRGRGRGREKEAGKMRLEVAARAVEIEMERWVVPGLLESLGGEQAALIIRWMGPRATPK
jgi:hypothetical protein